MGLHKTININNLIGAYIYFDKGCFEGRGLNGSQGAKTPILGPAVGEKSLLQMYYALVVIVV